LNKCLTKKDTPVTNKHMRIISASSALEKCKMKTTNIYLHSHYNDCNPTARSISEGVEKLKALHATGGIKELLGKI
jgi:hypothetical protein